MRTQRVVNAILVVVFTAMILACGAGAKVQQAADRVKYMNDLKQAWLGMNNYDSVNSKMPKDAAELLAFDKDLAMSPAGPKLQSGEITMVYGWKMSDLSKSGQGSSLTVMGWSNSPLFNGDVGVIMCDGTVQVVPQAQFQAMPRPPMPQSGSDPIAKPKPKISK
jgi:hypothetical protein